MIHEGGNDSFFLVPQSLLSPKQMTFIKGRTAGVSKFPRLKTGTKKNRINVESERSADFCFCSMTASLINLSEGCSCLKLF